ncbi:hypothetical protein OAS39_02850 [Pirellulales bacterium]|nr:hypothetical protein [Pirellulales bacterium]
MDHAKEPFNPFDPSGMLKGMRDTSMDAWAKVMVEAVQTDAYAEATGRMLDAWLSTSAPLRKAMEKNMTQALATLKLPSLDDVTRLGERLTNIEMRLDDLDAKLDAFLSKASENRPGD